MLQKYFKYFILLLPGGFFLLDQTLKWLATHDWSAPVLINRFVGWDPFLNPGIAFGLPLPSVVVLIVTWPAVVILAFLVIKSLRSKTTTPTSTLALGCLLLGALSNAIDRTLSGHTIDYLRIFYSIFNFADVLIVLGFVLYFVSVKQAGLSLRAKRSNPLD